MYKQEWVNQHAAKTRGEAGATPPCRKIAAPGGAAHSEVRDAETLSICSRCAPRARIRQD